MSIRETVARLAQMVAGLDPETRSMLVAEVNRYAQAAEDEEAACDCGRGDRMDDVGACADCLAEGRGTGQSYRSDWIDDSDHEAQRRDWEDSIPTAEDRNPGMMRENR